MQLQSSASEGKTRVPWAFLALAGDALGGFAGPNEIIVVSNSSPNLA